MKLGDVRSHRLRHRSHWDALCGYWLRDGAALARPARVNASFARRPRLALRRRGVTVRRHSERDLAAHPQPVAREVGRGYQEDRKPSNYLLLVPGTRTFPKPRNPPPIPT
jgi:hypothetical protein